MKDDTDACGVLGKQLSEPARFAYAGLCGVSLAQLFPETEQRSFCTEFVEDLVIWLALSDSVLPAMVAFASGLGGEGTETFTQMLLAESAMKINRALITQDLVTFSLRDGYYDARARVLITHITRLLCIPEEEMEVFEESLTESLRENKEKPSELSEASRKKREKKKKIKRYLLIGLATVGGGTMIGLTGGLAAPFVAAGAATIIGTAGAAALGSTAGIAIMASLFGAAGAGLTGYKMKKRVGAIEEFEFLPLTGGRHLHIAIAITGWLCTGKYGSFAAPWQSLLHSTEQYCLAWESKYLMELGNTLDALVNGLVNMMAQEALKYTVLSGIVTALTWPASLLAVASVIDNPWSVCLSRSAEVGKHLAHILLSRQQGKRPVTLVGFSLGARVIYFCLQEMAREKDCEGIIEDVVLLGAPVEGDAKYWMALTKVVGGRIINGYCRGDWLLSFVYRSSSVKLNVAGLHPVRLVDRRMVNVDLSSVVNGHLDYMKQMDILLKAVGIKTKECHLGEMKSSLLMPEGAASKADSACNLGAGKQSGAFLESTDGRPCTHYRGEGEIRSALLQPTRGETWIECAHGTGEIELQPAEAKASVEEDHNESKIEQSINLPQTADGTHKGKRTELRASAQDLSEEEQISAILQSMVGGKERNRDYFPPGEYIGEGEQSSALIESADSKPSTKCNEAGVGQDGSVHRQPTSDTEEGNDRDAHLQSVEGEVCLQATHNKGKAEHSSAHQKPIEGEACTKGTYNKREQRSAHLQPTESETCTEGTNNKGKGEHSSAQQQPAESEPCPKGTHNKGNGEHSSAHQQPAESEPCPKGTHNKGNGEHSSAHQQPARGKACTKGTHIKDKEEHSSARIQPAEGEACTQGTHNKGKSNHSSAHQELAGSKACIEISCSKGGLEPSGVLLYPSESDPCIQIAIDASTGEQPNASTEPIAHSSWKESFHCPREQWEDAEDSYWLWEPVNGSEYVVHHSDTLMNEAPALRPKSS
ncbi:transmembrane and coiled-coil domain-containing protein 4 isoform X2 [Ambystoma mexicanum]